MGIIETDDVSSWEPPLTAWMTEISPQGLIEEASQGSPQYTEDARDIFLDAIGRNKLVSYLTDKIQPYEIRVFHGTRLDETELARLKVEGLVPLNLKTRRNALERVFNQHPEWNSKKHLLDVQLYLFGDGWEKNGAGKREDGCIHACLSRAGLLHGCNHYLTHGAEVDGHIARAIFSDDRATELLRTFRKPKLISFTAPYPVAAEAANPYGWSGASMPSILEEIFSVWAYRLSNPQYQPAQERSGTALRFPGPISASRLTIEDVTDQDLERN